jgi:hypothetical protein
MKFWPLLVPALCLTTGFVACKKNTKSPIPEISFIALAPDTIHNGSYKDTAFLSFGFKDGDGDLGRDPLKGEYDVFLRDSRYVHDTSFVNPRFFFPTIPDDARDPINGLEGRGVIALRAFGASYSITPRQDTLHKLHGDTLTYQVWVVDQAGHISDTITTSPLYILPQ